LTPNVLESGQQQRELLAAVDWSGWLDAVTETTRIPPSWVLVGLAAQALLIFCLMGQWYVTRKRRRVLVPAWAVHLGILATLVLMIYAAYRHDLVFMLGQLINMVIAFRLLEIARGVNMISREHDENPFPHVRPDKAERSK